MLQMGVQTKKKFCSLRSQHLFVPYITLKTVATPAIAVSGHRLIPWTEFPWTKSPPDRIPSQIWPDTILRTESPFVADHTYFV